MNLDDTTVRIRLSDGSMILQLCHLDPGDAYEVDTPNLAFAIKRVREITALRRIRAATPASSL